jgi:hypothetical protein
VFPLVDEMKAPVTLLRAAAAAFYLATVSDGEI